VLVEINSHSLFSKWFSESGKLVRCCVIEISLFVLNFVGLQVQKMFQHITELVSDEYTFVCVLIDEVAQTK
jgi:hypothetical protein